MCGMAGIHFGGEREGGGGGGGHMRAGRHWW